MQEPISIKQEKIIKDMAAKYGATIAAKIAGVSTVTVYAYINAKGWHLASPAEKNCNVLKAVMNFEQL
ncbi:hypothetical protein ACJW8F_13145 [Plesiomonas shigelloides]|uniref:hypothetical protein n=1 Tax=Plesiomonas shigelloides TaxID=703 RepID=UPI00387F0DEA